MKRDSVSAYIHMGHEISSPCTQQHGFWMTPSPDQLRTNLSDCVEGTLELRLDVVWKTIIIINILNEG